MAYLKKGEAITRIGKNTGKVEFSFVPSGNIE
jgi:hypothetical protein